MYRWESVLQSFGVSEYFEEGGYIKYLHQGYWFKVGRLAIYKTGLKPSILTAIDKTKYFKEVMLKGYTGDLDLTCFEYTKMSGKGLAKCPKCGDILIRADTLVSGGGCKACAMSKARSATSLLGFELLQVFREVHGDRYDYDINIDHKYATRDKVGVVCREHGVFQQKVSNHLYLKQGCFKCSLDRKPVFGRLYWSELNDVCVYLLRISVGTKKFFKVGITKDLKHRVYGLRHSLGNPQISILRTIVLSGQEAWDLEKTLLREFVWVSEPIGIKFSGSTECVTELSIENFDKVCYDAIMNL